MSGGGILGTVMNNVMYGIDYITGTPGPSGFGSGRVDSP
jgi:hypothetical protein